MPSVDHPRRRTARTHALKAPAPISRLRRIRNGLMAGAALALVGSISPAWAQSPTSVLWTGGDGNWSQASWQNVSRPDNSRYSTYIDNGHVVINTAGATLPTQGFNLSTLRIAAYAPGDNASLTIEGSGSLTGDVAIGNSYYDDEVGVLTVTGPSAVLNGSILNLGTVTIENGGTVNAATVNNNGAFLITGSGSKVNTTGDYVGSVNDTLNTTTITNGAALNVGGNLYVSNGTFGRGVLNVGGAAGEQASAATLTVAGNIILNSNTASANDENKIVFNHTSTGAAPLTLSSVISAPGTKLIRNDGANLTQYVDGFGRIDHLAGITHLTGRSLAFLGNTNVSGGTLVMASVDSALGGHFNVSGSGTVGGIGTIGSLGYTDYAPGGSWKIVYPTTLATIGSGGTLAPGLTGQIGTLTVRGDLLFESGSTYAVHLASDKTSDLTNVLGNVTINNGAMLNVRALGGQGDYVSYTGDGHTYKILTATGALTGTFTDVQDSAFLTYTSSSDAQNAYVKVTLKGETPTEAPTEAPAPATQYRWTGAAGTSDWATPGNWEGGVPPEAYVAPINGTTVTAHIDTGNVVVDKAGTKIGNGLYIAGNAGDVASLTVNGAGTLQSSTLAVGDKGTGSLTASGAGVTINATGNILAGSQAGSNGTLTIQNGAQVTTTQTAAAGYATDATGQILVTGSGSSLSGRLVRIGHNGGTGTLTIANGASVTSTNTANIANIAGGTGTINIGAAAGQSAAAAGTFNAAALLFGGGDGTLVFNHTDTNHQFATELMTSGGTSTINHAAGTTHMTGASAAFDGTTNVTGGQLFVDGSLGGVFNVSGTGTLGGMGTIGASGKTARIASGGTLSPGSAGAFGTLNVTGDLVFDSGSTYAVNIAADKTSDLTMVGGTVTIANGAQLKVSALGGQGDYGVDYSGNGHRYTVLTSTGALSGNFTEVQDSAFLKYTTTSDGNNAYVTVALKGETPTEAPTEAPTQPPAPVTTYRWTGAAGTNDWSTAGNWEGGVPPTAFVSPINGTTVTARINDGNVLIDKAGTKIGNNLYLASEADDVASLTINGAGTLQSSVIAIGDKGTATMTASGSAVTVNSTGNLLAGSQSGSNGTLIIENGAKVATTQIAAAGYAVDATGKIVVTGAGSSLSGRFLRIGHNGGTGTLTIANGAAASAENSVALAASAGGTGTINIGAAAGQTAVAAGTLNTGNPDLGPGSLTFGAGTGTLVFNHTNTDYEFKTPLTTSGGSSTIEHLAGATRLTGDSSGFDGTTNVSGGKLFVDGKLSGIFNVSGTGTLGGNGTLGASGKTARIASGGTLSPGAAGAIGTLNVAGDLLFDSGSIYAVNVAADKTSDLTLVGGAVTINSGAQMQVSALGGQGDYGVDYSGNGYRYTVLTSTGALTGNFTEVQDSAFLKYTTSSDANNAYVTVALRGENPTEAPTEPPTQGPGVFQPVAGTPNQQSVAGALDSLSQGSALWWAVANVPTLDAAREAFQQLSGESHAAAQGAMVQGSTAVGSAVNNRMRTTSQGVAAPSTPALGYAEEKKLVKDDRFASYDKKPDAATFDRERFAVWGSGFGSWGRIDGQNGSLSTDTSSGGLMIGADGFVTDALHGGVFAGYSRSSFDTATSDGNSNNYHVGIYGGTEVGALSLRTGVSHTWHQLDTARTVTFLGETLRGDFDARSWNVFGEAGYRIDFGLTAFEPFANLSHTRVSTNGFTETGGIGALTVNGQVVNTTFTTIGLRAETAFDLGGIAAVARGMAGWRHAFGDTDALSTARFSSGDSFTTSGTPIDKNAALFEAGLDLAVTPDATIGLTYTGQIGTNAQDHGVNAKLRLKF